MGQRHWVIAVLTEYPINSRVFVSISRSIPAGLLGRVEDGPRAIIRNREIAWGEPTEVEDLVGQTRAAVVVGYNRAYEQLELSLRLVEWDPWQEVASRYHEDSEVEGRVVGLTEGGAFVELEPGIEGFMPASDLLPQFVPRIEDWLWINDLVKAMVTEVDPSRRRLRLGLKRLLLRREARFKRQVWGGYPQATPSEVTLAEILPADTRLQLLRMMPEPESLVFEPQVRVLIIEDDEDYGAGLHNFLQRNGCRVIRTQDGPAGLGQVQEQQPPFDLILIDWNLPGLQGHQVVHELQRLGCPSRLAMVLEPAPLRDQPDIWESLWASGVDVFSKTDGDQCRIGILSILRELRIDGSEPEPTHRRSSPRPLAPSLSQQASTTRAEEPRPVLGKRPDLQQVLAAVQHDTRASTVALLRLEPGRVQLQMEGCAGTPFPLEQAPPDLIYSPLNDVLQKGQEVWERVGDNSTKFRRLLDLMPFQSFLGLPLPAMGPARYGLILLKERGSFGGGQRQRARTALYLIAGIVQERRLTRALQPW